jgi:predicted NBD/HSP70 family sugar kinase
MGKREHFALFLAGFGVGAATAILGAPTSGTTAAAEEGHNKSNVSDIQERKGSKS